MGAFFQVSKQSCGPIKQCSCIMSKGHSIIPSLFLLIFIGVQLLHNVVLVSSVQQSESAICIHISLPFWISFPFRSPKSTEQSSLSYTVGSHQLSISYTILYQQCIYDNPNFPIHPTPSSTFPSWCPYVCSLHLCLYFCFANKIICTIFLDSTYTR